VVSPLRLLYGISFQFFVALVIMSRACFGFRHEVLIAIRLLGRRLGVFGNGLSTPSLIDASPILISPGLVSAPRYQKGSRLRDDGDSSPAEDFTQKVPALSHLSAVTMRRWRGGKHIRFRTACGPEKPLPSSTALESWRREAVLSSPSRLSQGPCLAPA